jgi:hypothetical protein
MNLRYLVPALGIIALTAASARAEDKAPTVTFAGWSDNILSYTDDDTDDTPASASAGAGGTAKDESKGSLRFSAAASLKAMWKVSDRVDAKVNLWFYPDLVGDGNSNFQAREMYVNVDLTSGFAWQIGKYIDHVGWIAAEPTGLYTVNNSLIGYLGIYGNDVIGTALTYSDAKKSPVSAQFHITNGYFDGADAISPGYVAAPSSTRENTDLGFGIDLTYALPNEKGNINFDFAYDMHGGNGAFGTIAAGPDGIAGNGDDVDTTGYLGGSALLLGLNATVKPVKELMIGAEIMYFKVGDVTDDTDTTVTDSGFKRIQGLLLANVAIPNAPWGASVTGMVQYIQIEADADAITEKEKRMEVAVALLTNPFGTSNFGLNAEIAYFKNTDVDFVTGNDVKGFGISVEALATF